MADIANFYPRPPSSSFSIDDAFPESTETAALALIYDEIRQTNVHLRKLSDITEKMLEELKRQGDDP